MSLTVNTLVFIDLETTGFKAPGILELCMLAIGKEQFMSASEYKVQNSIKLVFKPEKEIEKKATELTGLCADNLKDQEIFNEKTIELLNLFLSRLKKPVCLLAHNGNRFDFPILQATINKIQKEIMPGLWCADTIKCFKAIDKCKQEEKENALKKEGNSNTKHSYRLEEIYKRTFSGAHIDAHYADSDVHMMYEIALKNKEDFLIWLNKNAISFNTIPPKKDIS